MKGKIYKIIGIAVVAFLTLQLGIVPCSSQEKIKLKIAHPQPIRHSVQRAAELFKKTVEELTSDQVEITIFPAGTYGSNVDAVGEVMRGTLEMAITTTQVAQTHIKQLAATMLPFAIEDQAHADRLWSGPALKRVQEIYEKNNIKIDWPAKFGFRQMTANKPIDTPDDLKGLKMRVPPELQLLQLYKVCGAVTATVSFSELPLAIALGVVDGQCNPICVFDTLNISKYQSSMTLTNHCYGIYLIYKSLRIWNKLPPNVKAAIEKADKLAMSSLTEDINAMENVILKDLPSKGTKVYEITKANRDKFVAKMGPVHKAIADFAGKEWFDEWLGYVEKARMK
jgi:TRAP-type C4-dicarboxylate transport system substrate-binding protein